MSRYIAEIERSNISRIQLYINKNRKSLAQIKKETGADYLINAGFFEFGSYKQLIYVRSEWVIYAATTTDNYWGYTWNNVMDFQMRLLPANSAPYANHIAVCEMIRDSAPQVMYCNPDVARSAPRSVIGTKGGKICLLAQTNSMTPKQLQAYVMSLGWDTAVMLDGGGSTQCDFLGQRITSDREVANLILVYLKKPEPPKPPVGNPYPVPTRVLNKGKSGEDVKWVQFQINKSGIACGIDGSFGPATVNAVILYQRARGLGADGSVGPATRASLMTI